MDNINEDDANKIKKELVKSIQNYRRTLLFLYADAPIALLGLSKPIVTILSNNGLLRIYDLLDRDLIEIKGLGVSRIRELSTALEQFVSMC